MNDKGVSSVIGTLLMLTIVVTLFTSLLLYTNAFMTKMQTATENLQEQYVSWNPNTYRPPYPDEPVFKVYYNTSLRTYELYAFSFLKTGWYKVNELVADGETIIP